MNVVPQAVPGTVELHGHGLVGRAFAQRARASGVRIASIRTRGGLVEGSSGPCAILVDATPPAYAGPAADDWISFLERRLREGTSVVTCNKAPLALAWDRLRRAALAGQATLAASATVGGGTPVLPWVRRLRQTHRFTRLEATLSGTLGFVLSRVAAGVSLAEAVREAQALGYAEPDPTLDLDGTDARAKAILVHNAAFAPALRLADAGPALALDPDEIRALAAPGKQPAVVATIQPGRVALELRAVAATGHAPGTVVVRGILEDGASIELSGPGAGPVATAGALLADVGEVLAGRAPAGVWP